jgi:hypothetical protein
MKMRMRRRMRMVMTTMMVFHFYSPNHLIGKLEIVFLAAHLAVSNAP